jgi:hypothetical protein
VNTRLRRAVGRKGNQEWGQGSHQHCTANKSTGGWSVKADKPSALRHAVKLTINLINFAIGRM